MSRQDPCRILVVGASGYFGSLLVEDLLRHTDADLWVGSRGGTANERLRRFDPELSKRLTPCACDLEQPTSLEATVPHVQVAVCAAGPYQTLPLTLLESCAKHRVPYIDLADDRGFFVKATDCVARRDPARLPPICIGWSAVPALSGLLARMAVEDMDRVDALFIQIAPGNRSPRNKGTVAPCCRRSARRSVSGMKEGGRTSKAGRSLERFDSPHPWARDKGISWTCPTTRSSRLSFRRVESNSGSVPSSRCSTVRHPAWRGSPGGGRSIGLPGPAG